MYNINPIYNIKPSIVPAFKQKQVQNNVTNPIEQNVSLNGTDALASYNFNLINKNNDFNMPVVKMIRI